MQSQFEYSNNNQKQRNEDILEKQVKVCLFIENENRKKNEKTILFLVSFVITTIVEKLVFFLNENLNFAIVRALVNDSHLLAFFFTLTQTRVLW